MSATVVFPTPTVVTVTTSETAVTPSYGATLLAQLADIDLTGLVANNILKWNASTLKWEVGTGAGGGDLSAADIDTLAELNAIVVDATLMDAANIVSQVDAEAGTSTTARIWTAERVKQAIAALAGGGSLSASDIDTLAKLNAIVAETLVAADEVQTLRNKTISWPLGFASGGLILKGGNAPTLEGEIQFDGAAAQGLHIGTGAATLTWSDDSKVALVANNLSDMNAAASFTTISPLSAKGSLITQNGGGDNIDFPVGTDGLTLVADSSEVSGLKWQLTASAGISDGAVTNAKLADMAQDTIKGRVTAGTGDPEDLTAAQVRTLLGVEAGATADQTGAEIKTAYEGEADTNAFTDALLAKLNGLIGGTNKLDATTAPNPAVDDVTLGYEIGSLWIDVTADETYRCVDNTDGAAVWIATGLEVSELATVAVSGNFSDLVGTIAVAQIPNSEITLAKLADVATARIMGRTTAGTGVQEELTAAQAKTLLAVAMADITDASADGRSLVSAANYAAMRTLLDLEAGTDFPSLTTFNDHSARHESGGADAIKLDDLAAPDDNTDLDVSTTKHGLAPKLPNDATKYLDGTGAYSVPAGGGGGGGDTFTWDFSTTTADADPGANTFRLNSATPASVTFIYIDDSPTSGVTDVGSLMAELGTDDHVYVEDASGDAMLFKVSGTPTDGTGYWKIPVTHQSGAVLFTNLDTCFFRFMPTKAAAGGTVKEFVPCSIDGADSPIVDETRSNPVQIPYNCDITRIRMISPANADRLEGLDATGNVVVTLGKLTYAQLTGTYTAPTAVSTITLTSGNDQVESAALTDSWTAGDFLVATATTVDGTVVLLDLSIELTRT